MLRLPVVVACWPQVGAQWSGVGDGKVDGEGVGSGMVVGVFCPWGLGQPGDGPFLQPPPGADAEASGR